jgi:hypothetical protein
LRGTERSRLAKLSERDAGDWLWLAHKRTTTERFSIFDAYLDRVESLGIIVRTGVSALPDHHLDLIGHERHLDVYVSTTVVAELKKIMRLLPGSTGNLPIRMLPRTCTRPRSSSSVTERRTQEYVRLSVPARHR